MADSKDMRKDLLSFPNHVKKALELAGDRAVFDKINKILVVGMGSSATCGDLLNAFPLNIPLIVVRDYKLPNYIDNSCLVFVVSYSGNTEETVHCYREAQKKKAKVVSISSGGKLKELSGVFKTDYIQIPSGLQPRLSLPYSFFIILKILANSNLIENIDKDVESMLKIVKKTDFEMMGHSLAKRLEKKIPLIYASQKFEGVAKRWKTMINEMAKVHAFYSTFPEMNHNEIQGYERINGNYYVIMLKDTSEREEINKRYAITRIIIKGKSIDLIELAINGDCLLSRMFMAILIGDWTSYCMAMDANVDPSDISTIERLKVEMKKENPI